MNALEEYEYLNLQTIKEDTFGDTDILKMIIELFVEGIDEYVDVLNNAMPNEDWQTLFKATHKIKPNISMFGITKLESTILQLEHNFRNEENLETVAIGVESCISILKQVRVELLTELKLMDNG